MTNSLKEFQMTASKLAREAHAQERGVPPPDPYDEKKFPFGRPPGDNKFGFKVCATCGKPPTETGRNDIPKAFLFRNELSVIEYGISGMCQVCQDSVFNCEKVEKESK